MDSRFSTSTKRFLKGTLGLFFVYSLYLWVDARRNYSPSVPLRLPSEPHSPPRNPHPNPKRSPAVLNQDEETIDSLLVFLREDPNDEEKLRRLLGFYAADVKAAHILNSLEKLAEENPGSHILSEHLGELYLRIKDDEKAVQQLSKAVAYTPRPFKVLTHLTHAQMRLGDFESAYQTARKQQDEFTSLKSGKRDLAGIKDPLSDSQITSACLAAAYAAAKLERLNEARSQIRNCGKSSFGPRLGKELERSLSIPIDELAHQDVESIFD